MAEQNVDQQATTKPDGSITIDGKQYKVSDLSDDAKNQVVNVRVTDEEIESLKRRLAIAQTARVSYANALRTALEGGDGAPATEH